MKTSIAKRSLFAFLIWGSALNAHCQMPCGIYHDDMVFDQVDQYVETMYKACSILNNNKFASVHDHLEFTRWVINTEEMSNDTAELFLKYFLQQKIKPGESDTPQKLNSIHKLLFLIVQIKQNCDQKIVLQFGEEWENFKDIFHPQGYECQVELQKCIKRDKDERELWKSGATGATGTTGTQVPHTHGPNDIPHTH